MATAKTNQEQKLWDTLFHQTSHQNSRIPPKDLALGPNTPVADSSVLSFSPILSL